MQNRTSGFTLIELLIVIAIIGILAAVLIPNLLGARKRANDTVAKSYLADAVKMQEISQVDSNRYVDEAALNGAALGLKAEPQDTYLDVITPAAATTNTITYCMAAGNLNGTGKIFYATPDKGIYSTATPTMPTTGTTTGASTCP